MNDKVERVMDLLHRYRNAKSLAVAGVREKEIRTAIEQLAGGGEADACGFSLYLTREQWGVVTDGLILEHDLTSDRVKRNHESTGSDRMDVCDDLLNRISAAARNGVTTPPATVPQSEHDALKERHADLVERLNDFISTVGCFATDEMSYEEVCEIADKWSDKYNAMKAEHDKVLARVTWNPIETAPKDKRIMAWRKYATIPVFVIWDPVFEEFEDTARDHVYGLTHWMPIPEDPALFAQPSNEVK